MHSVMYFFALSESEEEEEEEEEELSSEIKVEIDPRFSVLYELR